MRFFYDTEFLDDGSTIDLISIGIVCEDGRELYLQSVEFASQFANAWVREHVLPHLSYCSYGDAKVGGIGTIELSKVYHHGVGCNGRCELPDCPWRTRKQIMYEVANFLQPDGEHTPFELWGWCSGYDFVALCQLFGTMMDLPQGYPHYTRDIQYLLDIRGVPDEKLPEQKDIAHNAINDARYIKYLWSLMDDDRWILGVQ